MKNVLIITQNEPFYIPKMIKFMLNHKSEEINIVGFTVLKPHRKNKSIYHWFIERAKIYSYYELMLVFIAMGIVKIGAFFSNRYSVKKIMLSNGVKNIPSVDINSDEYLKKIKDLNLDFIVSISCPHLFKENLLALPKQACLNAHGTLLPRHRGVFGSWWTIFKDDKEAGGTIHTMELKLDAGAIVWQDEFQISNSDTQYSVAYKTKKMMSHGLLDVMENFNEKIKEPIKPVYKTSYHRAPSKELGKEFHKKGKKVLTIKDLKRMLSSKY
ncbi:MAG: hypothetical protein JXR05_13555 [Flavobacteriaceae bacterium]